MTTPQNPAPTATDPVSDRRVQPARPGAGEVESRATQPPGPYFAEFGAIHHKDAGGFLFMVDAPEFAEDVAAGLNAGLLVAELVAALRGVIRLADMGFAESLREPEENGNYAAYERARAVLAKLESPQ